MCEKVKECMPPQPEYGEWQGLCTGCLNTFSNYGWSDKMPDEFCKMCDKKIAWTFDDRMRYD